MGRGFLFDNENLESISLPFLEKVGNGFLYYNKNLESISLPRLKEVGHYFLHHNKNKAKLKAEQYAKLNLEKVPQHYLQMTAHFAITGDKDAQ